MKPFEYYAPTRLAEACATLEGFAGTARPVAGGTDLLLKMKAGRLAPAAVVNLKRVPELRGQVVNSHLTLGALTTLEELRRSPQVQAVAPALAAAAATMASVPVRHLATLGGNLCNAAPSADLAPVLIALEATAIIAGPGSSADPGPRREVPVEGFMSGPGQTVLAPGEVLVAVQVPATAGSARYLKLAPRVCMDIAVVGIGLRLEVVGRTCTAARLVLGAVAPTPLRVRPAEAVLEGQPVSVDRIDEAASLAAGAAQPIDDVRGSASYRRQMVFVLVRRGLLQLAGLSEAG